MKVVQVAEAGDELAYHLEYVKRGGTVRIVVQGQPVADLVPVCVDNDNDRDDEALLAAWEKRGLVRRGAGGPLSDDLLRPGPTGSPAGVLDALLDERRSSR